MLIIPLLDGDSLLEDVSLEGDIISLFNKCLPQNLPLYKIYA